MQRLLGSVLRPVCRTATGVLRSSRNYAFAQGDIKIDVDSSTGIATIELCKAPVNSLSPAMLVSCTEAVKFIEEENDIRGALVKSKFDGKVFCAGLDLEQLHDKSHAHIRDYWGCFQDWFIAWYGCKKPTAAVINGHSPAGGCVLALTCDYRVMQSGARKMIGLNETRVGFVVQFFLAELLLSVIGQRAAEAALLDGTLFSAEEAKNIGLVDEIDNVENITSIGTKHLQKIISVPSPAYIGTKLQLRKNLINRLIEVKSEDCEEFARSATQPVVQEAVGKYLADMKARKK